MKNDVPETSEEALKLIEKQNQELQEQHTKLRQQQAEIQKQQEEIIKARAEIEHLNEQLAIKRAKEYAARSEKSSRINSDQEELPFDFENNDPENAFAEESVELTEET